MARTKIFESVEIVDLTVLRMKDILCYNPDQALKFCVNVSLLPNKATCENYSLPMSIEKRSEIIDGIQWRCIRNRKLYSSKTVRKGSFFQKSKLRLATCLVVFYMWANDYSNKQIMKETGLSKNSVCDWLTMTREVCQNYCHNKDMLGGPGRYIEIDESSICKRKYNRGRQKIGASQWVFGGVERGQGGSAFAFRVADRKKKTLLRLIKKHILPGTTIISDEWPAYKQLVEKMGRSVGYNHYTVCHKKQFARFGTVVEEGVDLRIHTNKCEGQWAHMKHKIKRLFGTSNANVSGYVQEAVFRQNCHAKGWDVLFKFFAQLSLIYDINNSV